MKLLLLLISLFLTSFELSQNIFSETIEDPIEFNLGEAVTFNLDAKNYFKFDLDLENIEWSTIFLILKSGVDSINLTDPNKITTIVPCNYYYESYIIKLNLSISGSYYFSFNEKVDTFFSFDNSFTSFMPGKIIETINLNENIYFNNLKIETISDIKNEMYSMYKVRNLNEDKYVFFSYEKSYFFKENYLNPYEICIDNQDERICVKNVTYYKFIKDYEYTIYIHFVPNYYNKDYLFYFPFSFFPIKQNSLQSIEQGFYSSLEPKLYILKIEENQNLYAYFEDYQSVFTSLTNQEINSDNLDTLDDLIFEEYSPKTEAYFNSSKYGIIILTPKYNKIGKVGIMDGMLYDFTNGNYSIPSGKSLIINLEMNANSEENLSGLYNTLTTYSSPEENLILIKNNEKSDFIVQNKEVGPIFVDKSSKDINIEIKTLYPKYAFSKIFTQDTFNDYLFYLVKRYFNYEFNDINEIFPINIRINSNMNLFYDFINLYFYNFNDNINLYINQIYGETDLYECNTDLLNNKNLSNLQNPITSCQGKSSIFNRLLTINDKKLIFGYLSHNSYFDIYLDKLDTITNNNDENVKIKISSLSKGISDSTSKYIISNIVYEIEFTLEHVIKLDPKFNAEVTITDNGGITKILNPNNPIAVMKGDNFKIKSNIDCMVYFYGKTFDKIKQKRIDIENIGKNIQIKSSQKIFFTIDIGFEGYSPVNIELFTDSKIRYNTIIFIENIYNKIKDKLVKDEHLYLYYTTKDGSNLNDIEITIEGSDNNLNNVSNKYNFYVVTPKSNEQSLIIYNQYIEEVIYQVIYCSDPDKIIMHYESQAKSEKIIEFNETNTYYDKILDKYGTKIKFETNNDFIFSYSLKDYADQKFALNEKYLKERKELDNLIINNISFKGSTNNILLINFLPNYKNSNTRYIIVIASKDEKNTLKNFQNSCYIAKLVTEGGEKAKIVDIYDKGENDLIEVEVEISDILNKDNGYVVNVISQELRFDKKINFYSPKEFSTKSKNTGNPGISNVLYALLCVAIIAVLIFILYLMYRYSKRTNIKQSKTSINNMNKEALIPNY